MTDDRLTDDELAAMAARAEAATPGPWTFEENSELIHPEGMPHAVVGSVWCDGICNCYADIRFIAAARADIPALLAHIRAQDAELARLRDALAAVCEACTKIATFEPGGELSFDRWDRGHRAGWRMAGKIAKQALEDTTAARALLDLGNGD